MNWLLVQTPPKVREITLNAAERRRSLAEKADGCVRWLKSQGFDVIRVEQGACGPRIAIRNSPLCKKLEGTVSAYSRQESSEKRSESRYCFCFRFGCEVRWYEPAEGGAA